MLIFDLTFFGLDGGYGLEDRSSLWLDQYKNIVLCGCGVFFGFLNALVGTVM